MATVDTIEAVFVSISGTTYRALDFYVNVLEKAPVGNI
jgi:hypothetical protein